MNISDALTATGVESGNGPASKASGSAKDALTENTPVNASQDFSAALTLSLQQVQVDPAADEGNPSNGNCVIIKGSAKPESQEDGIEDKKNSADTLDLPQPDYTLALLAQQPSPHPLIPMGVETSPKFASSNETQPRDGGTTPNLSATAADKEIPPIVPQSKPPALPAGLLQLPGMGSGDSQAFSSNQPIPAPTATARQQASVTSNSPAALDAPGVSPNPDKLGFDTSSTRTASNQQAELQPSSAKVVIRSDEPTTVTDSGKAEASHKESAPINVNASLLSAAQQAAFESENGKQAGSDGASQSVTILPASISPSVDEEAAVADEQIARKAIPPKTVADIPSKPADSPVSTKPTSLEAVTANSAAALTPAASAETTSRTSPTALTASYPTATIQPVVAAVIPHQQATSEVALDQTVKAIKREAAASDAELSATSTADRIATDDAESLGKASVMPTAISSEASGTEPLSTIATGSDLRTGRETTVDDTESEEESRTPAEIPQATVGVATHETAPSNRTERAHSAGEAGRDVDVRRVVADTASGVTAAHLEGHQIYLRLDPRELGSLRIEVSLQDGQLTARLEAERSSSHRLLTDNLPELREQLSRQGVQVDRIEVVHVSARSEAGGSQTSTQSFRQQDRQPQTSAPGTTTRDRGRSAEPEPNTAGVRPTVARGSRNRIRELDITV